MQKHNSFLRCSKQHLYQYHRLYQIFNWVPKSYTILFSYFHFRTLIFYSITFNYEQIFLILYIYIYISISGFTYNGWIKNVWFIIEYYPEYDAEYDTNSLRNPNIVWTINSKYVNYKVIFSNVCVHLRHYLNLTCPSLTNGDACY